jgi:hypothetical protein
MTYEASPADIEKFCKKLEQFSAGLSDTERTLLKSVFDGQSISDDALGDVRGGAVSFAKAAPKLNSSFFLGKVFGGNMLTDW